MLPPATLLPKMERQLGLITWAQLKDVGVPHSTISSAVAEKRLVRVCPAVYSLPGSAMTPERRLMAAVLRCGKHARITGPSACALYHLEGFSLADNPCIVMPEGQITDEKLTVIRSAIPPCDRAKVGRLPTVTPTRALIDAAIRTRGKTLRVAIDDARRRKLITLRKLLDRALALGRHPGALAIVRLFDSGLLDQDGEAERQLALTLAGIGLFPVWGAQVLPGVFPDAHFAEASLVLERDGEQHHTIAADRASDVSRDSLLRADGWWPEHITTADMQTPASRAATAERIRSIRAKRMAAQLGRPPDWKPITPGRRLRPPRSSRRD